MTTIQDTLDERGKRYGKFSEHAEISQALSEIMHATEGWRRLAADQREALEMVQHKVARILNGTEPDYADNWVDIAGYATLCVRVEAGGPAISEPPPEPKGYLIRDGLQFVQHLYGCQCVQCADRRRYDANKQQAERDRAYMLSAMNTPVPGAPTREQAATKAWNDQLAREQGADEAREGRSFFDRVRGK